MNIHFGNCLATIATSKTFRYVRKLTESIRNDISLINWENVLNETDAEVGDDILQN